MTDKEKIRYLEAIVDDLSKRYNDDLKGTEKNHSSKTYCNNCFKTFKILESERSPKYFQAFFQGLVNATFIVLAVLIIFLIIGYCYFSHN